MEVVNEIRAQRYHKFPLHSADIIGNSFNRCRPTVSNSCFHCSPLVSVSVLFNLQLANRRKGTHKRNWLLSLGLLAPFGCTKQASRSRPTNLQEEILIARFTWFPPLRWCTNLQVIVSITPRFALTNRTVQVAHLGMLPGDPRPGPQDYINFVNVIMVRRLVRVIDLSDKTDLRRKS